MVVLMVRLDLRHGHEEGLFAGILVKIVQRKLVNAVGTVALEIDAVVVLIKHIAIVAVGGELQHIRSTPVTGIATAQLQRNSGDGVVNGGLFLQLTVRSQMPLADVGRLVAGILFHVLAQRLDVGGQHQIIAEATGLGGIFAGLEQSTAGAAHRLRRKGIVKLHTLCRQLVQIRRDIQWLAEAAAGVPALLVTEIENDIICHGFTFLYCSALVFFASFILPRRMPRMTTTISAMKIQQYTLLTKILGLPSEMSRARRKLVSVILPSTIPNSTGTAGSSSLRMNHAITPNTSATLRSK